MKSLQRIEQIFSSGRAETKMNPIQKGTGISLIFDIRGNIKLKICLFPIEMAVLALLWQSDCGQQKSVGPRSFIVLVYKTFLLRKHERGDIH